MYNTNWIDFFEQSSKVKIQRKDCAELCLMGINNTVKQVQDYKVFIFIYECAIYYDFQNNLAANIQKMGGVQSFAVPFAIGGISGSAATMIIQPLDTLKVQIQVASEKLGRMKSQSLSLFSIINKIKAEQGLKVLYRGLDSAIFRQIFYASARLGAYEVLLARLQNGDRKASNLEKAGLSFLSGAFGALVGNPFDVALIRRQASIANGKNAYKNTYAAFKTIIQSEGLAALWSGINITILRVGLINIGQLAGRDYISEAIQPFGLLQQHNNVVALAASALTSAISLPADNIKVKLQKQDKSERMYKGIWDCLLKSIQREGFTRLWVGFPIYFIRGAPHSFILIRTQMFLNQKWRQYNKKE